MHYQSRNSLELLNKTFCTAVIVNITAWSRTPQAPLYLHSQEALVLKKKKQQYSKVIL